jgi:hypothetical protein
MAQLWAVVGSFLSSLYGSRRLVGPRSPAYRLVTAAGAAMLVGFTFSVIFVVTSFADELLLIGLVPGLVRGPHAGEVATIVQMSSAITMAAALSYLLSRLTVAILQTDGPV